MAFKITMSHPKKQNFRTPLGGASVDGVDILDVLAR